MITDNRRAAALLREQGNELPPSHVEHRAHGFIISWLYHTPRNRCVRFVFDVAAVAKPAEDMHMSRDT